MAKSNKKNVAAVVAAPALTPAEELKILEAKLADANGEIKVISDNWKKFQTVKKEAQTRIKELRGILSADKDAKRTEKLQAEIARLTAKLNPVQA